MWDFESCDNWTKSVIFRYFGAFKRNETPVYLHHISRCQQMKAWRQTINKLQLDWCSNVCKQATKMRKHLRSTMDMYCSSTANDSYGVVVSANRTNLSTKVKELYKLKHLFSLLLLEWRKHAQRHHYRHCSKWLGILVSREAASTKRKLTAFSVSVRKYSYRYRLNSVKHWKNLFRQSIHRWRWCVNIFDYTPQ